MPEWVKETTPLLGDKYDEAALTIPSEHRKEAAKQIHLVSRSVNTTGAILVIRFKTRVNLGSTY